MRLQYMSMTLACEANPGNRDLLSQVKSLSPHRDQSEPRGPAIAEPHLPHALTLPAKGHRGGVPPQFPSRLLSPPTLANTQMDRLGLRG